MSQHFRRYLIVNLSIILASFVVFGLLFYGLTDALGAKTNEIVQDRMDIDRRTTDQDNLSDLKAHAAAAAAVQKNLDQLLPPEDALIGFPQFMTALARTHSLGVTFNFSGAKVPPTGSAAGSVPFEAILEGAPQDIRGFLDDVENHATKFLINIDQFDLTSEGNNIYRADLRGNVYFRANDIRT